MSFLSNVTIENAEKSTRIGVGKKQRNPAPEFLGFRLWSDGSVYPSQSMTDTFGLEYPAATVSVVQKEGKDKNVYTVIGSKGTGLDIVDTRKWAQMKGAAQGFIAAAFSPKDSPKIDLFGLTRYSDKVETLGQPLVSVMEQGSATYGKETLLPLVKELYGAEPNEEGFIDMQVITVEAGGINLRSANGFELLPKVISRGADAGKDDYSRRENVDIFMLYPVMAEAVTETIASEVDPNQLAMELPDAPPVVFTQAVDTAVVAEV